MSQILFSSSSSSLLLFFFLLLLLLLRRNPAAQMDEFVFNGFRGAAQLALDGFASITPTGLLVLTNTSYEVGHAFHNSPLHFQNLPNGAASSFSTTFVFGIVAEERAPSGQGLTFVISNSKDFTKATGSQYFGLFNTIGVSNSTSHVLAIELDTIRNPDLQDINNNHVGIDIGSYISSKSNVSGYYADDSGLFKNLSLTSGKPMQVWVDYNSGEMQLNVTLAPVPMAKPRKPLLSETKNISGLLSGHKYIGFSSATGPFHSSHCVLGWSFKMNGVAPNLNYSSLPSLPPRPKSKNSSKVLEVMLPIASAGLGMILIGMTVFFVKRRNMYAEVLEDWEVEFGPHRFAYKELFEATKGFNDRELLGIGGFGRVYKGVLPSSKREVAVKRVSHESRQGMREFIAEVVSLGRLRHRNLVQLLGYCRRKGELLLVYDYMPNGSLDRFLYDRCKPALDWASRLRIIKGVAAGLLYLHEEWEKVVVHRDIKSSNVLIDNEINGRLSDFGLARLYDHGADPHTTSIVGTMGYLAPELARIGKASTATDVFAFGTFVLEVTCGRRPFGTTVVSGGRVEPLVLLDWVGENWRNGTMLETRDPRLGDEYVAEELELVMTLGLLCANPLAKVRPSIRQVVQCLQGEATLPELSPAYMNFNVVDLLHSDGFDGHVMPYPLTSSSVATASVVSKFSRGAIFPSAPDSSGRGFESSQVEVAV